MTHLELELTKDIAESVLGARKGGVRNMLAISALEKGGAVHRQETVERPTLLF